MLSTICLPRKCFLNACKLTALFCLWFFSFNVVFLRYGDVTGLKLTPNKAQRALEQWYSTSDSVGAPHCVVLLLDELDSLVAAKPGRATVLHTLLEWMSRPRSRLIIIGYEKKNEIFSIDWKQGFPTRSTCWSVWIRKLFRAAAWRCKRLSSDRILGRTFQRFWSRDFFLREQRAERCLRSWRSNCAPKRLPTRRAT